VFFLHFVTLSLTSKQLPLTNPFPGPRSVLLLDNARIHHLEDVTNLVHSFGKHYTFNNGRILTQEVIQAVTLSIYLPIRLIINP